MTFEWFDYDKHLTWEIKKSLENDWIIDSEESKFMYKIIKKYWRENIIIDKRNNKELITKLAKSFWFDYKIFKKIPEKIWPKLEEAIKERSETIIETQTKVLIHKEEIKVKPKVIKESIEINVNKNKYISPEWELKNITDSIWLKEVFETNKNYLEDNWIDSKYFTIVKSNKEHNVVKKVDWRFVYAEWNNKWKRANIYNWDIIKKGKNTFISPDWELSNITNDIWLKKLFWNNEEYIKILWIKTESFSIRNNETHKKYNVVSTKDGFFYDSWINLWRPAYISNWDIIWKSEENITIIKNNIEIPEDEKVFLNFISIAEWANKNSNILFWDNWEKENKDRWKITLSINSIQEVIEFQEKLKSEGKHTAIWYYQIKLDKMKRMAKIFWPDEKVSEKVQHQMWYALLLKAGLNLYKDSKLSRYQFMLNLSKEWASLPKSNWDSYYKNTANNKAKISYIEFTKAVKKLKNK
jgi:hypothetical protein